MVRDARAMVRDARAMVRDARAMVPGSRDRIAERGARCPGNTASIAAHNARPTLRGARRRCAHTNAKPNARGRGAITLFYLRHKKARIARAYGEGLGFRR